MDNKARATVAILVLFYFGYFYFDAIPLLGINPRYARPTAYFLVGVIFWLQRDWIPLNAILAIAAVAIPYLWLPGLIICLPYLIFYAAYALPRLNMDQFGDYSYGLYLYAWPAQQMIFWQGQSAYVNAALATLLAGALAVASWHFIERPALGLKARLFVRIEKGVAHLRDLRVATD